MWKLPYICFPLYLSRFIPPSFHLFLGLLTLFTDDKNLDELTGFPVFLRAGLCRYIDRFIVGEKSWSIATACEERTVPHTAVCLCFLYYYFWNLFAITETWLKCKAAGKTPSHIFTHAQQVWLAGCSWGHPESLLSALCNLHMPVSGKYLHSRCTRVCVLHVPGSGCQPLFIHN